MSCSIYRYLCRYPIFLLLTAKLQRTSDDYKENLAIRLQERYLFSVLPVQKMIKEEGKFYLVIHWDCNFVVPGSTGSHSPSSSMTFYDVKGTP